MKRFLLSVLLTLIVLLGIGGCASIGGRNTTVQPPVIMEVLDPSLRSFETPWRNEISRRFGNAVGILVHGGDFVEGQWIVGAHIQREEHVTLIADIAKRYQAKYPGRTIVLLACNTGHLDPHVPGVFYAKSSVWCVPDRALTPAMFTERWTLNDFTLFNVPVQQPPRWEQEPDYVGNIFEFVESK